MPSIPPGGTTSRQSSGFSETASHSDASDLTPEEFQRRGDATDALSRETALRGAGSDRTDFVVTSRDNPQPWCETKALRLSALDRVLAHRHSTRASHAFAALMTPS